MIKSKDIADYIELKTKEIIPDQPIPGDLYLYFAANRHVLVWKPTGTVFSKDVLKKLIDQGITSVWVHKTEWEAFYRFLHPVERDKPDEKWAKAPQFAIIDYTKKKKPVEAQELIYHKPKVSSQNLIDIVSDETKDEREKSALLAKSSRKLLTELVTAKLDKQFKVNQGISKVLHEFLKRVQVDAQDLTADIWEVTQLSSETSHSVNVATFSVLFGMAMGKSNEKLLLEIASAALLHDVGMSQIPYQIVQTPLTKMSSGQEVQYLKHAGYSADFITAYAPHISKRIVTMVSSHHNDFGKSERMDTALELGQLIAMADELDSRCNGNWDGQNRSVMDVLTEMREQSTPLFNKRVSTAILRWVETNMKFDDQAA